jgi:hypothetical protein
MSCAAAPESASAIESMRAALIGFAAGPRQIVGKPDSHALRAEALQHALRRLRILNRFFGQLLLVPGGVRLGHHRADDQLHWVVDHDRQQNQA